MRLSRSFLFAATLACLAFSSAAAHAQRAYPNPAMPRVAGTPMPMDPSWAFAFDPLFEDPMWRSLATDPLLGPMAMPSDPNEAARMAESMRQRMSDLRRMGAPGAAFAPDPTWGALGFDTSPLYTGMGGPMAGGSAAGSAWSYSSETDENGCTRSRSSAQTWPGAPQSSSSTSGNCTGARRLPPPEDDDDLEYEIEDDPEGRD